MRPLCVRGDEMRVCVLYGGNAPRNQKLKELADKMSQGISASGHIVDTFDMGLETGKIISFYDYIVVISETTGFFGKGVAPVVRKFLKTAGTISGKKCSCYISNSGLRKVRVLQDLMRIMESEGMFLKISDILTNGNYAYAIGKRLQI